MVLHLQRLGLAVLCLLLGAGLAAAVLESVFRSDPTLLPRGMAAPLPVDAPLTDREYDIRYADADIFYWEGSIVQPPPVNKLEARVRWRTDEFGFPNPAPIPSKVDVVVLGRSYAMGAQAENPWPELLRAQTGLRVLNLSQTGAGLDQKWDFLRRFGLPRQPRYVVIEILPPMDILQSGGPEPLVVQRAVFPLAQEILRKLFAPSAQPAAGGYIYPLPLEFAGGSAQAVFYSGYLSAATISARDWARSEEWKKFSAGLTGMIATLRDAGIIPILLFVPTKETVYIPQVLSPSVLAPALANAGSWIMNGDRLEPSATEIDPDLARNDANAAETLLGDYASGQTLCLVDPSGAFWQSILQGADPFMRYDTHWSAVGHELVAGAVRAAVDSGACR